MSAPVPPVFAFGHSSQAPSELFFGCCAALALAYCVRVARRERSLWPLFVYAGSALAIVYEPVADVGGHCVYAQIGQHTLFTELGRHIPVMCLFLYLTYFPFGVTFFVQRFDRGVTRRQLWRYYLVGVVIAACFEPLIANRHVGLTWWFYYGHQPLNFTGLPMWWWFVNPLCWFAPAAAIHLVRRHVLRGRGRLEWVCVPLVGLATFAGHGSAALPMYLSISSNASNTVEIVCTVLAAAIASGYIWMMGEVICIPEAATVPAGVRRFAPPPRPLNRAQRADAVSVGPAQPRVAVGLKVQRWCIWAGLAMVPVFFVGLGVIAHFIPPPSPGMSTTAVARMYQLHHGRIRIGVSIAALAAPLLALFFAVIGVQMRRIEGRYSPLAYVQMMLGACLVLVFIVPMWTWETAAYRPFRAIETTQALNDLAWLPFVGIVSTFIFQAIAIAVAILTDTRRQPVFPRWAAYVNLWAVVGVLPGAFVVFVKHGPLGWNGLLAWWLIIITFFVWMCVMARLLFKAIDQQGAEDASAAGATGIDDRVEQLAAQVARLQSELERVAGTRA